jgi:hypothetical protein
VKHYFTLPYLKGQRLLLLAFLLVHIIVASVHISQQSITFDEEDYYAYSVKWLQGKVERADKMYDSKSPFTVVAAIPRIFKQLVNPGYKAIDYGQSDMLNGRYFMVIYTIIIALYLFTWIRKLFGAKAWIFPMLFFLFEPTVLSYSMIITSDMASGACLLATMFHLYAFYESRKRKQFILFSLCLGLSFVCKASLLFLLPCLLLLLIVLVIMKKASFNSKKILFYGLATLILSLAVINILYFGKDSFRSFASTQFRSETFRNLSETPLVKNIPLPLPHNYVDALDLLQYHKEIGAGTPESSYPGVVIGDKIKYKGGYWYYYLYTGFFKIPVAILVLMVIGLFSLLLKRFKFSKAHWWYIIPAIFFFLVLSIYNPFQLGFRHFLLIFPLLFIAIAGSIHFCRLRYHLKYIPVALLVYMIISVAFYFPYLLSYSNEFVINKSTAFHKLRDGSIDYGHNTSSYNQFLKENKDYQPPPVSPAPGKYIVKASQLMDLKTQPDHSWLNAHTPVDHYQFSMFLFHITQADIEKAKGRQ